jgi:beta-glucosidase
MKRSPLCGRNFEYYSEDPVLAGEMGSAFVNGVQKNKIGTSLKHFAANNQEYRRMSISAQIDERTLREIYLAGFERIIKKSQPWTVMCSYNRINGTYSCENQWLLDEVLRKEWGFEGLVMTDWGAMNERVKALTAGLDLEMPDCHGETDQQIVEAVQQGSLDIRVLDQTVRRILTLVDKYTSNMKKDASYDREAHHLLAKKTACDSAVLLKNEGILPLKKEQNVAVIGAFAKHPRFQGGGSSHINCYKIESAMDLLEQEDNVSYAQGYTLEKDEIDPALEKEAVELAQKSDVAVIFAGLPDAFESEGFDRDHLNMPSCQNHLIDAVCDVQPNTVVVLHNGSPILMPWIDKVKGILEMYLAGQAAGSAAVDLLYGNVNPSGKLAETFPLRLEDNPSYLNFPGNRNEVCYQEGIFIGYRYYDKKKMDVLFPFGYGLSYTTFQYSNPKLTVNGRSISGTTVSSINNGGVISEHSPETTTVIPSISAKDRDHILVSVDITNTGILAGQEVVQLYVKNPDCPDMRPDKELKDFAKIRLEPRETKTVTFELDYRCFAYYNCELNDWYAPTGDYELLLAASSRDVRQKLSLHLESTTKLPFYVTDTSSCGDVFAFANDPSPLEAMLEKSKFADATNKEEDDCMGAGTSKMMQAMFADTPLHSILSFSGEDLTWEDIQNTIRAINEKQ